MKKSIRNTILLASRTDSLCFFSFIGQQYFVVGYVVQHIARLIFTFTYRVNGTTTSIDGDKGGRWSSSIKIGIFAGLAMTSIIWFLLVSGLKNSTLMTAEAKDWISQNTLLIWAVSVTGFSLIMTILSFFEVSVLKGVVLSGTFALAMAFAGNDLVNFIGVPLTGLESLRDYWSSGAQQPDSHMMDSLMGPSQTPSQFLVLAGLIMVLFLIFSKKAQNVTKTEVGLSAANPSDEGFRQSRLAQKIVDFSTRLAAKFERKTPPMVLRWMDSRFNADKAVLPEGAAYDLIRASINLVVAGSLVAMGTSLKLPLSTTYVSFMVAMGTSLADKAWSKESAASRITGVLSVISGWFVTAGAAFLLCFVATLVMYYGSYSAMVVAVCLTLALMIGNLPRFKKNEDDLGIDFLKRLIGKK